MRTLVVEDNKNVASFVEQGLREEGYAVGVAHDGVDGALKAAVYNYDLLVIVRGLDAGADDYVTKPFQLR